MLSTSDLGSAAGGFVWPWRKDRCAVWGSFRVQAEPGAPPSYRLVVFAPGVEVGSWVCCLDRWFTWGFAAWMFAVLSLKGTFGTWSALAVATVFFVIVTLLLERRARPTRRQARTLTVLRAASSDEASVRDSYALLVDSAAALQDADRRLARGAIDPAQHEVIWSAVYHRLPVTTRAPRR